MQMLLSLFAGSRADDHRAVFADFAQGLARMLSRRTARARVRAVGS